MLEPKGRAGQGFDEQRMRWIILKTMLENLLGLGALRNSINTCYLPNLSMLLMKSITTENINWK